MKKLTDPTDRFPRKISEHIHVLGNHFFNLFLVQGKRKSALVETGVSAIVDSVIEQLDDLQIEPDYLVLAHPHADHLTGLPGLIERYPDAPLVVADGASEFLEHPKAQQALVDDDGFLHQALKKRGINPGREPINKIELLTRKLVVKDVGMIDLGGVHLSFFNVRGHSPGSIIAHVPEDRAVIASDSLGFHFNGRCFLPLYFTGYDDFIETLEKIRTLNPTVIGLGHQSPFIDENAAFALDAASRAAPELFLRIRNDARDDDAMANLLFEENYRDEFTIYTPENILNCCRLLVKRSRHQG